MKIIIEIDTDNDAFQPDSTPEVARIVLDWAKGLKADEELSQTKLYDSNGNPVGWVTPQR